MGRTNEIKAMPWKPSIFLPPFHFKNWNIYYITLQFKTLAIYVLFETSGFFGEVIYSLRDQEDDYF